MWWDILFWWWAEWLLWKTCSKRISCLVLNPLSHHRALPWSQIQQSTFTGSGKSSLFHFKLPFKWFNRQRRRCWHGVSASVAILRLSHIQNVIFSLSCPVTPTNTPSLPLLFSPSWLSNKAMGHISEAFRGSLAHPLVSANHCCNRKPNLYHSFNQTQTAGSSRSRGGMIQLPQRHQAKTDIKLKIKTLVMAQWHGKSIYDFQCENWSAIFLFRGRHLVLSHSGFQLLSQTQILLLLAVSHWDFGSCQTWSDWQTFGADSWQRSGTPCWKRADRRITAARYLLPSQGRWIGCHIWVQRQRSS